MKKLLIFTILSVFMFVLVGESKAALGVCSKRINQRIKCFSANANGTCPGPCVGTAPGVEGVYFTWSWTAIPVGTNGGGTCCAIATDMASTCIDPSCLPA